MLVFIMLVIMAVTYGVNLFLIAYMRKRPQIDVVETIVYVTGRQYECLVCRWDRFICWKVIIRSSDDY